MIFEYEGKIEFLCIKNGQGMVKNNENNFFIPAIAGVPIPKSNFRKMGRGPGSPENGHSGPDKGPGGSGGNK
jgi:hypothetical protein